MYSRAQLNVKEGMRNEPSCAEYITSFIQKSSVVEVFKSKNKTSFL